MADITPFYVMDIFTRAKELAAQGQRIIHMEIGEPDFLAPEPVIQSAIQALTTGHTRYTATLGLPALREKIADFYLRRYGVNIPWQRIVVTPGTSGALQLALAVLVNPGDEVLVSDPGYPSNRNMIRVFGGSVIDIPVGPDTLYQPTADLIARYATPSTAAAIVTTPSNPTGSLMPARDMVGIIRQADRLNIRLVVDELYLGLVYGATATDAIHIDEADMGTAAALSEEVFIVNGFSKYFGMTGWRLGWMVVPESFLRDTEKLAQNLYLSASAIAQHGALVAFEPRTLAILDERREEFQHRRDFLLPALRDMGFYIPVEPHGAFYLYADCSAFTKDSLQFANELLEHTGVAVTPGIDFGQNAPRQYVRFAYTTGMGNLQEGVGRLRRYLS
uniref:Aminotransferase n=1 Tax=Candidatus Kentrum sp. FW TaxID=2126338 RepID=A0A450TEU7_9GAMM|nr:MAG: Aspartate/methionine/tyrosine aminotransferase [Candidatus Kentron sp. FW]